MHTLNILFSKTNTIIGGTIRTLLNSRYNHCAIALDNDFSRIYSFARRYKYCWFLGCFVNEPFSRFKDFEIYSIDITDEDYDKINTFIQDLDNHFCVYNYIGAILLYLGIEYKSDYSYVCSTFTAKILSLVDSIELDRSEYAYKPNDLYKFLLNGVSRW